MASPALRDAWALMRAAAENDVDGAKVILADMTEKDCTAYILAGNAAQAIVAGLCDEARAGLGDVLRRSLLQMATEEAAAP